jgi:hypothetical protein
MNPRRLTALLLTLVAAVAISACSGGSPSQPAESSNPSQSPHPSELAASPEPSEPAESPQPSASEAPETGLAIPSIAEAVQTADVLVVPVVGQPVATVAGGDRLSVNMGPVTVGVVDWYLVAGEASEWSGWISADMLEASGAPEESDILLAIAGNGSGDADAADVAAGGELLANVMAMPTAGNDACEIDITVVTPDGTTVQVSGVNEMFGPTGFFQSALENADLRVETVGQATLQVRTDCTFAGTLSVIYP